MSPDTGLLRRSHVDEAQVSAEAPGGAFSLKRRPLQLAVIGEEGYRNNTDKDIAGVKGYVSVKDLFGDELSGFLISNDDTIKAGGSVTWTGSRSVRFAIGNNKDRKLAELADDKFKVEWQPRTIVFADGTTLTDPK